MVGTGDPLRTGLVASLARPGGNVTGLTQLGAEVAGKRLQILKDTVPNVSRVAFLRNRASPAHVPYVNELQAAARGLRLTLQSVEVQEPYQFERAFAEMMRERPRRAHRDSRRHSPAPPGKIDARSSRRRACVKGGNENAAGKRAGGVKAAAGTPVTPSGPGRSRCGGSWLGLPASCCRPPA